MHSIPSFPVFVFWSTSTRLAPLDVKEAYCILYIHTTVELAACQSGMFSATFLPNGSDERQRSGRIKRKNTLLRFYFTPCGS